MEVASLRKMRYPSDLFESKNVGMMLMLMTQILKDGFV